MSIVRIGLGEREGFAEGWEAVFGKSKKKSAAKRTTKRKATKPKARKKGGRK